MRLKSDLHSEQHKKASILTQEQEDAFIQKSAALEADKLARDNPRKRTITGRGRPAASGFHRTSMDLPQELYRKVKHAGIEEDLTLREIVVQSLELWLTERNS